MYRISSPSVSGCPFPVSSEAEVFGTVEAVKTVSDLYMPVSGTVTEINEALEDKAAEELEKINSKEQQIAEKKAAQQKLREDRLKAYEFRKQKLKEAREKKKSDKLPAQQKDSIPE